MLMFMLRLTGVYWKQNKFIVLPVTLTRRGLC